MPVSRIGVCSWSLQPAGPEELIQSCRNLDIPNIQLALSPLIRASGGPGGPWADAISTLHGEGIRIVSGMMEMLGEDYSTLESIARTGGVRPDDTWAENLAHTEAVAEFAERESLPLVTFHAGFIPELREGEPENPERMTLLDRLETIADLFARRGIELALETGQETAANLESSLDEMNRPNLGVNFDPANMILYNMGDPIEALQRLATRIRQIHIKDALPPELKGQWGMEVPVGRGRVDWERFFEIALGIDPPVKFIIEREAGNEREKDIARAKALILDHLAQL